MIVIGRRQPQRAEQENLASRRLQQIRAPHNFADPHGGVIDHDRQLIRRDIVAAPDNEVSEIASGDHPLRAEVKIGEQDLLAIGNPKAPVHTGRFELIVWDRVFDPVRRSEAPPSPRPAFPRIDRLIIRIIRRARRLRHVFSRTSTRINHPQIAQLPPRFDVVCPPFALCVRTCRPSAIRPFDPVDPKPAQVFEHGLHELRSTALRIQVLVAENQLSVMLGSTQRRRPEGARMAEVQQAGRGRREASAISLEIRRCVCSHGVLCDSQPQRLHNGF